MSEVPGFLPNILSNYLKDSQGAVQQAAQQTMRTAGTCTRHGDTLPKGQDGGLFEPIL